MKGMSNIYLKAAIEKNWRSQNFDFIKLKNLSRRYHWILKLVLQLKNQRSASKTLCGFSIILILKEIMTF